MEFWWPWAASFSPLLLSQGRVKTRVVLPEADPSPEYVPSAYPGACRKEPWGDPRLFLHPSSHTFCTVLELESHLHGCSHLPGHRSHGDQSVTHHPRTTWDPPELALHEGASPPPGGANEGKPGPSLFQFLSASSDISILSSVFGQPASSRKPS